MKDKRYDILLKLFEAKHIKNLSDIFETVPPTVLARDIRKNKEDLNARMADLSSFTLKELDRIAALIGVPPETIINVVMRQLTAEKKWPSQSIR